MTEKKEKVKRVMIVLVVLCFLGVCINDVCNCMGDIWAEEMVQKGDYRKKLRGIEKICRSGGDLSGISKGALKECISWVSMVDESIKDRVNSSTVLSREVMGYVSQVDGKDWLDYAFTGKREVIFKGKDLISDPEGERLIKGYREASRLTIRYRRLFYEEEELGRVGRAWKKLGCPVGEEEYALDEEEMEEIRDSGYNMSISVIKKFKNRILNKLFRK